MTNSRRILVIGIGGMGRNALLPLIEKSDLSTTILLIDTDAQSLEVVQGRYKLLIGASVCRGIGTGRNVVRGKESAARSLSEIKTYLNYANTICLVAGLGGGTGSGTIQIIAQHALDLRKEVICLVSTPFRFEGQNAETIALEAIRNLDHMGVKKFVLNNQDLLTTADIGFSIIESFKASDKAICEIISNIQAKIEDLIPLTIKVVG